MAGSNKVKLTVVTPVHCFFEDYVSSITLPSLDGEIGIMAGHSPLVFALSPGIAHIRIDSELRHFVVSEGYVEVNPKMVLVVCDSAEWPEDLDVQRVVEALVESRDNLKRDRETGGRGIVADEGARTAGYVEDSVKSLSRARARVHTIEVYGTDAQKARLQKCKAKYGI